MTETTNLVNIHSTKRIFSNESVYIERFLQSLENSDIDFVLEGEDHSCHLTESTTLVFFHLSAKLIISGTDFID